MDNLNEVTLKEIVKEKDVSQVFEGMCSLNKQLQYLHSNDYYVTELNSTSVIFKDYYGFKSIARITDFSKKDYYIRKNVIDLMKLSLGCYVSLQMNEDVFYDYTSFDDDFITNNYYNGIRQSIPYYQEYYDNMVSNILMKDQIDISKLYFNEYIERHENETPSKSGNLNLIKSTPTGKALTDFKDAAFADALFYPTIIGVVVVCILIIYIIYTYLF